VKDRAGQAELLEHRWYLRLQQPQPLGNPRRLSLSPGFPGDPERHVTSSHDGYPTEPAWRFAVALP